MVAWRDPQGPQLLSSGSHVVWRSTLHSLCVSLLFSSMNTLTQIPIFSDLWIYRKAQRCGSHYRRISFVCCLDREICIRCSSGWQVRLRGWCGLDHGSHVSVNSFSTRASSSWLQIHHLRTPRQRRDHDCLRIHASIPHSLSLLGNGCKAPIDSILFRSHCHPAVASTWSTACSRSWFEQFACNWYCWRANQPWSMELVQWTRW